MTDRRIADRGTNGRPRADPLAAIDDALRRLGAEIRGRALVDAIRCGPYALVRLLSEGSASEVFLGIRVADAGVPREVAVKILKPGVDAAEFLARFEREQAILRRLDHPGIVRAVASGTSDDGRPWFAMPFELGAPCTDVANARRLPLGARLALFAEICDAIAAAHAAGVVHRDLKPANVLLVERDGRLAPSVIDFGIARALDVPHQGLTPAGIAHRLGTPDFMSPEQWKFGIGACDPRSDVFALGMLLGVLAAGVVARRTPSERDDGRRRRSAPPGEPCLPSEALATLGSADEGAGASIARARGCADLPALRAALAPVDRIVRAACAAKDARPADAAALARLVRIESSAAGIAIRT